jgi:hypothetical protein
MHRGHRHFRLDNDGLCVDDTRHVPGDRHWDIGVCDDEWTGEVSARVCPVDDIPILGHDERGWSCCERCGLKAVDVPVRTEAPW